MKVLQENRIKCHLLGLICDKWDDKTNWRNLVINVSMSIGLLATLIASIAYVVVNRSDLKIASHAAYLVASFLIALLQYWIMIYQRSRLAALFEELQIIVNQSE